MTCRQTLFNVYIFILSSAILFSVALPGLAAEQYEGAVVLKASSLLPQQFQNSTLFKIDERVANDGFINTYTVKSADGTTQVNSNIALYKLLREIEAIEAMKKIQESDAFIKSLKESGVATVEGIKNLFNDPGDTLDKAASGLGSLFTRAEESLFKSSPGESEDSRLEQTVGFSNAKRQVAYRYKVDVYSRNPILQEHLDRLAWAEYAGGFTLGVATLPLGGVAGITLSVSGTARLLGEVIATTPPAELKLQNRAKLAKMGIDENLADLFVQNPHFTPLQQTAYVMALEKMKTAKEQALPLQAALQVNDQDMARNMTAIMAMFAGYNERVSPIVQFKTVARFFCGVDKNGQLIVMLPADYITLNKRLVSGIKSVKNGNLSGYALWTIGTVSPKAQEYITKSGWHLEQKAAGKIGLKINDK
ncbi:MAG: hypothetical protein L3J49_01525 [Desulfobulbaceae bacterium]|nr:hypothetical protein [Desulfobulbaceae bacterium]